MRDNHFSTWTTVGLALLVTLFTACSTTEINSRNTLIQHDSTAKSEYAKVYFIRPNTEHMQGFPDNPLNVLINGQELMKLGKGEYTLVYLKPHEITVTLENLTQTRGRWEVETVKQSRTFDFEAGQIYFLVTQPVDGEFRGVHFRPELRLAADAKVISKRLKAVGQAKQEPIQSP